MTAGKMTNVKFAAVVLAMCSLWYGISSTNNVLNKIILQVINQFDQLTLVALLVSFFF